MKRETEAAELESRNTLVERHLYLVQHIVNDVAARFPAHVDRSDLWSAGAQGLVEASRRYEEDTGVPFARYAAIRIKGAILDSTRSRDLASRAVRRAMREEHQATQAFEHENGRSPTTEELTAHMGISTEDLDRHRSAARATSVLCLDSRTDDEESTLGERLVEQHADVRPEESLATRELTGTVRTAVAFLPEPQREVIVRSFFQGDRLKSIADSFGLTEARVSQLRSEGLNAIKAYLATTDHSVPALPERTPGQRRRAAYIETVSACTTWRSRLKAADKAVTPAPAALIA